MALVPVCVALKGQTQGLVHVRLAFYQLSYTDDTGPEVPRPSISG